MRMKEILLLCCLSLAVRDVWGERETENLSALSPDHQIFVVRENGTTCLMVEFLVKFVVPYDVLALNGIDLIMETTSFSIPPGAQVNGRCGQTESELQISWNQISFQIYFVKEKRRTRNDGKLQENDFWKINRVQLLYDTSETMYFINAYNAGKHRASTHSLSALVTPAGRAYVCSAQQSLTLISSDHQKGVSVTLSEIRIQPFDIQSDFTFSPPFKCVTDQREQLEHTLPLVLGLILGLIIVLTISIYHFHVKLSSQNSSQAPPLQRERSMYKNM
ncbi:hypothetical protein DNTS_009815 [Danionella cerebrum]|uniref:Lysosome-associated membrane glycoprotein 5 n=1 Tax=Danionella cerebrum TaxID=2873325 RepID=A0A553MXJ5_9TELE|nr:hypothetical protein DNTS_009815 [Danionella translucida]